MLVGAFQIHHRVGPPSTLRLMPASAGKCTRVLQHEGVRRARVEPDVADVVDLLPGLVGELAEEALARAGLVPGVGALGLEGLDDAQLDLGVLEDFDRAVGVLLDEHGDRHAPGALARDHPVGPALDHAGDAVLARGRHPAGDRMASERALAQRVGRVVAAGLLGRPPIGLSMAMNHCGVLRKMIGFFERQECGY